MRRVGSENSDWSTLRLSRCYGLGQQTRSNFDLPALDWQDRCVYNRAMYRNFNAFYPEKNSED